MLVWLGGDEFGILLENCLVEKVVEIVDYLCKIIQDLYFIWSGQLFNCIVSVGLVYLLLGILIFEEVLCFVDMVCYMVKEKGCNWVQVFYQDDVELLMCFGEMIWVQCIYLVLEEDCFSFYVQFIVLLGEGVEEGLYVELLLCLCDEGGCLVLLLSFIFVVECYGLMMLIDCWVVENVFCIFVECVQDFCVELIGICVINFFGVIIGDELFLQFFIELFVCYCILLQMICFEVIEIVVVVNLVSVICFINEFKDIGCCFFLDDFCVGMLFFIYFKYLLVDYLKMDGSFVKDMFEDFIDCVMVQVINYIGYVMGKCIIVEFVEIVEVMEVLCEIGIDYVQGLVIGVFLLFSCQFLGVGVDVQGLWLSLGQNFWQVIVG